MEERKAPGIIFYDSYFEDFELLSATELATVIKAVRQYFHNGKVSVDLNRCCRVVFNNIKRNMDSDNERYEKKVSALSNNGKKGGRPKRVVNEDEPFLDEVNVDNEYSVNETILEETQKAKKAIAFNNNKNNNENENINTNNNTNTTESEDEADTSHCTPEAPKGDESVSDAMFDAFWMKYPRKTGKQAALRMFHKINPDPSLFGRIMDSLEEQKKTAQWKSTRYIPHASTWLYGKRWEDEITPDDEPFFGRIDTTPTNISELDQYF